MIIVFVLVCLGLKTKLTRIINFLRIKKDAWVPFLHSCEEKKKRRCDNKEIDLFNHRV